MLNGTGYFTFRDSNAALRAENKRLRDQLAAGTKATPAPDRELFGKLMNAQFEIDGLRKELEEARKSEPEQVASLRQRIRDLEQELARHDRAAKAAQSKVKKPALPPDEVRERRIEALTIQVQNLKQLLSVHEQHYAEQSRDKGVMTFKTVSLISKALTSQRLPTDADREEALRAFNAWKSDSKAAADSCRNNPTGRKMAAGGLLS